MRCTVLLTLLFLLPAGAGAQAGARRLARDTTYISGGRRLGAVVVDAYVGLGSGELILGNSDRARRFLWTQTGSLVVAATGLLMTGCSDPHPCTNDTIGQTLFFGGAAVYVGSRVWELVDVIAWPVEHNSEVDARKRNPQPSGAMNVSATVLPARSGAVFALRLVY